MTNLDHEMQQIRLLLVMAVQLRRGYNNISDMDVEHQDRSFRGADNMHPIEMSTGTSKIRISATYWHGDKESQRVADVLLGTLRLIA